MYVKNLIVVEILLRSLHTSPTGLDIRTLGTHPKVIVLTAATI